MKMGIIPKNKIFGSAVSGIIESVGNKIKYLKAGDKVVYTADRTGIVFLAIHETVFNSANSGYYNASVRVK